METVRASGLLIVPEKTTAPGLQRLWSRRLTSSQLNEDGLFDELFSPAQVNPVFLIPKNVFALRTDSFLASRLHKLEFDLYLDARLTRKVW